MWIVRLALVAHAIALSTASSVPGLAAGTTGGGNAAPVYPATNAELEKYLKDTQPRVIVLTKTFDFRNTEGSKTEPGCQPKEYLECAAKRTNFKGQLQIVGPGTGGCDGNAATVTYDLAGKTPMTVTSNKSIRGEGTKGVIIGKGLEFRGNNIIVQNIHVTNINPHIIWGGDALFFPGINDKQPSEKIWIDHVKVSLVGRQMVVISYGGVKSLTISNTEFDGQTPYSSSCDGRHYWGFITDGMITRMSLINSIIHHHSGRGPKIGTGQKTDNVLVHAANNYFTDNSGHSFDVGPQAHVLIEGNYFEKTTLPITTTSEGDVFVPTAATVDSCQKPLGRKCVVNTLVNSGALASVRPASVLTAVQAVASTYATHAAQQLSVSKANFGVGDVASSGNSSASTEGAGKVRAHT